jgi:hypothetical protein
VGVFIGGYGPGGIALYCQGDAVGMRIDQDDNTQTSSGALQITTAGAPAIAIGSPGATVDYDAITVISKGAGKAALKLQSDTIFDTIEVTDGSATKSLFTQVADSVSDAFATAADSVQASPSPSTTAFAGSSALSSANSFYVGSVLLFTSGALDGLARKITSYTGSSRLITVTAAWPTAPTAADTFRILGRID